MSYGASGEDVDLWLEEELFFDVRLESGEWVEGESISVKDRWILIRFPTRESMQPLWLNVDTDCSRLAELHTKSGHEAQAAAAAAAAKSFAAQDPNRVLTSEEKALHANAVEMYQEVLTRAHKQWNQFANQTGSEWLTKAVESKVNPSNGLPSQKPGAPSLNRSMSELPSSSSAALIDDDGLVSVSSVSIVYPLFDPQLHDRLMVPVRAPGCSHPEAIDLWTHIVHRLDVSNSDPIWTCPMCKKEAWSSDLIVDPILFHTLRLIEDGRLLQHARETAAAASNSTSTTAAVVAAASSSSSSNHSPPVPSLTRAPSLNAPLPTYFTFTATSPLMSHASFLQSLEALESLKNKCPKFGESSSKSGLEERRLTVNTGMAARIAGDTSSTQLRLILSTEADDAARREAKRHMSRRARTVPTQSMSSSSSSSANMFTPPINSFSSPSAAAASRKHSLPLTVDEQDNASPFKKQKLASDIGDGMYAYHMASGAAASSDMPATLPMDFDDLEANGSAPAAAIAAAAKTFDPTTFPWPCHMDEYGLFWIDVTDDSIDIESPDRWANIKVKLEKAHQAYMEMEKQKESLFFQPPPMPVPASHDDEDEEDDANEDEDEDSSSLFPSAASFNRNNPFAHAHANPFNILSNHSSRPPAAASFSPARAAPPFSRASTLPATSSPSGAKKNKKLSKKALSQVPAASPMQSNFEAASVRVSINRASLYDLLQVDGVGEKMAQRILNARMEKWLLKKVKHNDEVQQQRKRTQTEGEASTRNSEECDCADPMYCRHVQAFSSFKSVGKIEGIGPKMLGKLKDRLTTD